MPNLCDSAKKGQVCIDDLCRNSPDNTLCGFDQSEYEEMTREYDDDEPPYEDDGPEFSESERGNEPDRHRGRMAGGYPCVDR